MRLLFIADVMGKPGRRALEALMPALREELAPDAIVVNAENAAGGAGVSPKVVRQLFERGADVLTGGNHSFDNKDGVPLLESDPRILRPHNYPPGTPGTGRAVLPLPNGEGELLVLNLMGRVFMTPIDCPFRCADAVLAEWAGRGPVFVDMHAEASSEKVAIARHLDGRVTAVVGTHTHVQTADAQVLPGGTALLTDGGMTGSHAGVIGVKADIVIHRFLKQTPLRFEACDGALRVQGACIDFDPATGKAQAIARVDRPVEGG